MASNLETQDSEIIDSDDENLGTLKRKAVDDDKTTDDDKRTRYSNESDDESFLPEVLVKVEVEVVDDQDSPWDFSASQKNDLPATSKQGSKPRKRRRYTCRQCKVVFDSAPDLRVHSITHQIETRHKCDVCGRCFNKSHSLKIHKSYHKPKEKKCPLCDLSFTVPINMGRHMMSHERTEKCVKCPAKFHTKEQLEEHVTTHLKGSVLNGRDGPQQTHGNKNQSQGNKTGKSSDKNMTEPHTSNQDLVRNEIVYVKSVIDSDNDKNSDNDGKVPIANSSNQILKREDLSHHTQCAIVSKMHRGRSVEDICSLYRLTPDVVNEIWEDREEYTLPGKGGEKTTKYMNSVLEKRILEWFNEQRSKEVQVTGKMIQDIAEAFAKEIGFVTFNGSKKWLDRFKKKHDISLRVTPRKREYYNNNAAAESKWKIQFFNELWCDVRVGVCDDDIYTADEVGVYYNASKSRIKKLAGKKFIQGHVKDRLAIFMCTNVTGRDKKKLLVCGSEDPLIHSYRDPDTLPVTYIRHSQGHFTTHMFEAYVKYWNNELQASNRKVLLILDRATIHSKLQLSHLKLVFVPWKASASLIPIKNGIFTRFRNEFRQLLLEEKAMNAIRGVDRNLTCLEALNMLEKAWERTPTSVVFESFRSIGYDVQNEVEISVEDKPKITNDEENLCNMLKDYNIESYFTDLSDIDMYLTVDEEHLTGQGTNRSVFGGNHKGSDPLMSEDEKEVLPLATEKPESSEKESLVRRNRAFEDLEIVKNYLGSNSTTFGTFCSFMEMESFIINKPTS